MQNEKCDKEIKTTNCGKYNFVLITSIISTLILGLLAHGFAFANLFPSHDSLVEFDCKVAIPHKIKLGRYMYAVLRVLLGESVGMPWLTGMLSLFVIGLACFYICKIFNFGKLWQIVLVSGVMATNLVVCATIATYSWDLLGNCMALFFSVLAVYWFKKSLYKIGIYDAMAFICLIISMGFYQAFIAIALTLMMFVYIMELIGNKDQKMRTIVLSIAKVGGTLLISCLLYYLSAIIVGKITHCELYPKEGYNSISIEKLSVSSVIANFIYIYRMSFEALFAISRDAFTIATFEFMEYLTIVIHVLLTLFVLVVFGLKIAKEKLPACKIILILTMAVLLPLAMNFSVLISGVGHIVTRFGLCMVYILVPIACMYSKEFNLPSFRLKYIATVALVMVFVIVAKNVQVANQVYVKKNLIEQTTLSNMTRVLSRIEAEETYEYGKTTVVLVGAVNDIGNPINNFTRVDELTGVEYYSQVSYTGPFSAYCKYYLQYDINVVEYSSVANEVYDQALEGLDKFPNKNCVLTKDGMIFIKL